MAAGVRRIEAVTGAAAEAIVLDTQTRLNEAAGALRAARFIMDRQNGLYDMADVLGLKG